MVDTDLRAAVAQRMGMKPSEIVNVAEDGDSVLVVTHDGVHSRIDESGVTVVSAPAPLPRDPSTGEIPSTVAEQPAVVLDEADRCTACGGTGLRGDELARADEPSTADAEPDEADGDEVPDGTAKEVLAWVGSDPDRARRALQAEQQREDPRSGLTGALEKVVGGGEQ